MNTDNLTIEIVTEFKHVQVKESISLFDSNGVELGSTTHATVVKCGDWAKAEEYNLTGTAKLWWTNERVAAYEKFKLEQVK